MSQRSFFSAIAQVDLQKELAPGDVPVCRLNRKQHTDKPRRTTRYKGQFFRCVRRLGKCDLVLPLSGKTGDRGDTGFFSTRAEMGVMKDRDGSTLRAVGDRIETGCRVSIVRGPEHFLVDRIPVNVCRPLPDLDTGIQRILRQETLENRFRCSDRINRRHFVRRRIGNKDPLAERERHTTDGIVLRRAEGQCIDDRRRLPVQPKRRHGRIALVHDQGHRNREGRVRRRIAVTAAASTEYEDSWKYRVLSPPPEHVEPSIDLRRVCHDAELSTTAFSHALDSLFKQSRCREVFRDASHKTDLLLEIPVEVSIDGNLSDEIDLGKIKEVDHRTG